MRQSDDRFEISRIYEKEGFLLSNHYLDDNIGGKELRQIQYYYNIG